MNYKVSTVNRGDFGQIFTIFINIFIMMNSILGFIWGLVLVPCKSIVYYMHSTLADCYILKYFILNLVQSHHGLRGDFGHTNIWFSKVILLQGFKIILSVTYYGHDKCLTQTAPFIIKPVDGRFDCSFSTNSGKFDLLRLLKIDRF